MPSLSRDDLIKAVIRSRLIEKADLDRRLHEFMQGLGQTDTSAERFARFLIVSKDLTKYQAERLLAGRTEGFFLGGCKILDRLGAGGMGAVYLAEQTKLGGRKVAVKVLPAQHVKDPKYVARFQREACAVAELKHPNVVQIYDVGQEGNIHFLVMELVQGTSLEKRLDKEGPLPVAETVDIIEQTARGLDHAHKRGIVHRDIKPSNLMLEGTTVKILDLGLAKKEGSGTITQEQRGMGTPDYMSPEQFSDAKGADARSDLYSLGCTWYHLLTGRVPFPDVPLLGKAMAHLMKAPEPIANLRPDVPAEIVAMIDKLTAKNPEGRFTTAEEFLAEIKHWRSSDGTMETTPSVRTPRPKPSPPASATVTAPSITPVKPAAPDGQQSLIRAPVAGLPTLVLYLIPVLAAMVLGGVYIGMLFLRGEPATEVIMVPPKSAEPGNAKTDLPKQNQVPPKDKDAQAPSPKDKQTPPPAKEKNATPEKTKKAVIPSVAPKFVAPKPKRAPKTWLVSAEAAPEVVDLGSAWRDAEDGDHIHLVRTETIKVTELPPNKGKRLDVLGKPAKRTILLFELPEDEQTGRGLWRVEEGSLTLQNVDIYIDLSKRAVAGADDIVLFELVNSDFLLKDASITVIRGKVPDRSPVTAIKFTGERPWDARAKGNPPKSVQAEIRNAMIRGPHTVFHVDSTQSDILLSNSIVCSPGTVLHFLHTRKHEFDHQHLVLDLASCTLDTNGPIVTIECRPFQLPCTPLTITADATFFGSGAREHSPAVVLWRSPIDGKTLSTAIKWWGKDNCYFQRGDGLMTKQATAFVEGPLGWAAPLGKENSPKSLKTLDSFPKGAWHKRSPERYRVRLPARFRPTPGADAIRIKPPRALN